MVSMQDLERLLASQSAQYNTAEGFLAEAGSPSVSVAVLDGGKISTRCFSSKGDDETTRFQACSISKPIAGLATMKLVEQGHLKLDSRIVDILPQRITDILCTEATNHLVKQVTIRHLLSHTSGLSVHGFRGYPDKHPSTEETLQGAPPASNMRVRLQGIPGHAFSYSGGGLTVLELVLEHVTGKGFEQIVKELVLEPLGMTDSTYSVSPDEPRLAHAHYTGYQACESPWFKLSERAAAGLWTTPRDLLKAIHAVQRSALGKEDSFLRQDLAQEMLGEVCGGWALSWIVTKGRGITFGHSGSNEPGWRCVVMGYLDLSWGKGGSLDVQLPSESGISVMTNSAEGDTAIYKIVDAIAYLKGWPRLPRQRGFQAVTVPLKLIGSSVDPAWAEWIGTWSGGWSVGRHEEGTPVIEHGGMTVKLLPAARPAEKGTIDLVFDGLEMMVRLTRRDGVAVVELHNGGPEEIEVLERG